MCHPTVRSDHEFRVDRGCFPCFRLRQTRTLQNGTTHQSSGRLAQDVKPNAGATTFEGHRTKAHNGENIERSYVVFLLRIAIFFHFS